MKGKGWRWRRKKPEPSEEMEAAEQKGMEGRELGEEETTGEEAQALLAQMWFAVAEGLSCSGLNLRMLCHSIGGVPLHQFMLPDDDNDDDDGFIICFISISKFPSNLCFLFVFLSTDFQISFKFLSPFAIQLPIGVFVC